MNNNLYVNPTTDTDFRRQVTDMLLGSDWYVVDSMNQEQVNTIAIDEIQRKYCYESIWSKFLRSKQLRCIVLFFICVIGFILSETLIEYGVIRFVISTWCLILMIIFTGFILFHTVNELTA